MSNDLQTVIDNCRAEVAPPNPASESTATNYCRKCMAHPAVIKLQDVPLCERCANDLFDEACDAAEVAIFSDFGQVDLMREE